MVPCKELRELIVLYYDMKVLNDLEFLLLHDLYSPQNLDLPCDLYPHFDLQNLTEGECVAEFRFRKTDIPWLSQALRIPEVIICHQGTICEGTEGLCMLLKRLCYPCRYNDMVHLFARPVPVLCMITNKVLDFPLGVLWIRLTTSVTCLVTSQGPSHGVCSLGLLAPLL